MARGGLYRAEIERARATLVAEGKNPSIDAIRVALGNTGSRSTIHRWLKEIQADEARPTGEKVGLSDAITDLVSKLSERLQLEADEVLAGESAKLETARKVMTGEAEAARREASQFSDALRRTESELQAERAAHAETAAQLTAANLKLVQLEERVLGLQSKGQEQEAHAASLEDKHRHAREALEHFRTSAKEQREQEQRRHAAEAQGLQLDLRRAAELITKKNEELLALNRDNVRLTDDISRLDSEAQRAATQLRDRQHEIDTLKQHAADRDALAAQWADEVRMTEQLRRTVASRESELERERERRLALETTTGTRLDGLEALLKRLSARPEAQPEQSERFELDAPEGPSDMRQGPTRRRTRGGGSTAP